MGILSNLKASMDASILDKRSKEYWGCVVG